MEIETDEKSDAVFETAYLESIPVMKESIIEGMNTPIEECSDEPGW